MPRSSDALYTEAYRHIAPFAKQLQAAVHRDATHVPYSQWAKLYIQGMHGVNKQHQKENNSNEVSRVFRSTLNAMLLSSVVAPRWEQVVVPKGVEDICQLHHSGRVGGGAPWHSYNDYDRLCSIRGLASCNSRDDGMRSRVFEILTPSFMAEPLLGGSAVASWGAELRAQANDLNHASYSTAAAAAAASSEEGQQPLHGADTAKAIHVVIPFSTLWQLKTEAHARIDNTMNNANSGNNNNNNVGLSLQERRARQTLLLSINQLMEVQHGLHALRGDGCHAHFTVSVLSPTEELDALCGLPRCRKAFSNGGAALELFNMRSICEKVPVRLSYITHYHQILCANSNANTKNNNNNTFFMVAHSNELQALRAFGLSVKESPSSVPPREQFSPDAAAAASSSSATHRRALQSCGEAVKRMTAREENIRQSFTQRS